MPSCRRHNDLASIKVALLYPTVEEKFRMVRCHPWSRVPDSQGLNRCHDDAVQKPAEPLQQAQRESSPSQARDVHFVRRTLWRWTSEGKHCHRHTRQKLVPATKGTGIWLMPWAARINRPKIGFHWTVKPRPAHAVRMLHSGERRIAPMSHPNRETFATIAVPPFRDAGAKFDDIASAAQHPAL